MPTIATFVMVATRTVTPVSHGRLQTVTIAHGQNGQSLGKFGLCPTKVHAASSIARAALRNEVMNDDPARRTMTRRRWIADEVRGNQAILLGDHAAHLARVLRARVGQDFDIAADGKLRRGTISEVEPDRVVFELGAEIEAAALPDITLLLAVFKFDRMEWAIEKCTELGISEILPVISRRVEAHLSTAAMKRLERWRRLAVQASQQSRRITPPQINEPMKLQYAIERQNQRQSGERIVLAESGTNLKLSTLLESGGGGPITIAVGPEGGWTEEERAAFAQSSWTAASLGPTILRAETAAIAAVAVIVAAMT